MLNRKDFEAAMTAALEGPTREDLTIDQHTFRVRPVERSRRDGALQVAGHLTRQISWWPDDQIRFSFAVTAGDAIGLDDVDISVDRHWLTDVVAWLWENREKIIELIQEWLEEKGGAPTSKRELAAREQEAEEQLVEATKHLLDGSWQGEASFLIANIAGRVALGQQVRLMARTLPDDEPSRPSPRPRPGPRPRDRGRVDVPVRGGRPRGKPGPVTRPRPRVRDHRS